MPGTRSERWRSCSGWRRLPARWSASSAGRDEPLHRAQWGVLPNRRPLEQRAPWGTTKSLGRNVSLLGLPLFVRSRLSDFLEAIELLGRQKRANLCAAARANRIHLRLDRLEQRVELPMTVIEDRVPRRALHGVELEAVVEKRPGGAGVIGIRRV